jgi:hypothetical protein
MEKPVEEQFGRRGGVDADHGIKFEYDVTCAINLRCSNFYEKDDIKLFRVANNVDGVGNLDDTVFGVEYEEGGETRKKLVFMQTKHASNSSSEKSIDRVLFESKQKNVLMTKILDSICHINKAFLQATTSGTAPKRVAPILNFECDFKDCIFVFYTNAVFEYKAIIENSNYLQGEPPGLIKQILNMACNTEEKSVVLKLNKEKCNAIALYKNEAIKNALQENFYIYLGHGCDMESIINMETGSSIGDIYKYIIPEMRHMVASNQTLTEQSNVLDKVQAYVKVFDISQSVKRKLASFDLFKIVDLDVVIEKLCSKKTLYLQTTPENILLDTVKYMNIANILTRKKANFLHIILKDTETVSLWEKARSTETYRKYETIFVCVEPHACIEDITKYKNTQQKEYF